MKTSITSSAIALTVMFMILACSPDTGSQNQEIWFTYPAEHWNSQSLHLGEIILLPALPAEWSTGSITGLKARGGYTVDIFREKGELVKAAISGGYGVVPGVRVVDACVDPGTDQRIEFIGNQS